MKKVLLTFSALALFSCSQSSRTVSEPFPNYLSDDVEWIVYEGTLPAENGQDVEAELELLPGAPGTDSYYKLYERLTASWPNPVAMGSKSHGRYSVLAGTAGHHILQIHSRTLIGSIMFGKNFGHRDRVTKDLFLESAGEHELVMVDENFEQVVPRYRLIRRSELFTVEGYFTVYSDAADYFEKNTRKEWSVAQLACYDEVVTKYYALAKEQHEGIYVKALSYTVRQKDKNGKERDALVFKRILQIGAERGI